MEGVRRREIGLDLTKLITHRFAGIESIPAAYEMAGKTRDEKSNLVIRAAVNL